MLRLHQHRLMRADYLYRRREGNPALIAAIHRGVGEKSNYLTRSPYLIVKGELPIQHLETWEETLRTHTDGARGGGVGENNKKFMRGFPLRRRIRGG